MPLASRRQSMLGEAEIEPPRSRVQSGDRSERKAATRPLVPATYTVPSLPSTGADVDIRDAGTVVVDVDGPARTSDAFPAVVPVMKIKPLLERTAHHAGGAL